MGMGGQELKTVLGKNIKFFRFRGQLSQADLAEKADISITYLSSIERGLQFPKPEVIIQLAEGLDIEVYELFKINPASEDGNETINRLSEDMIRTVNQAMEVVFRQYSGFNQPPNTAKHVK